MAVSDPTRSNAPMGDVTAMAARIRRGELSSLEATERYLGRISRLDSELHVYVTVTGDLARQQAREADRALRQGKPIGPLHGVPIALKDNIDTAGVLTTAGSAVFANRVPEHDAAVVSLLRDAGAIVLGKVALHEFAYGATGENRRLGAGRNAWSSEHISGGSSGGSAVAVSAGLCAGALGTDTGGSVRVPAALNGVTGMRPTAGRVPIRGVFPVTWTFDTVGTIGRSAEDAALMLSVLYRPIPRARLAVGAGRGAVVAAQSGCLTGIRVGIPASFFFEGVESAVSRRVTDAVEALASCGAAVCECDLPHAAGAVEAMARMVSAEAYAIHRDRLDNAAPLYDEDVRARLLDGRAVSGAEYASDREYARRWRRSVREMYRGLDVIATPTTEATAPMAGPRDMVATTRRLVRLTSPWSLAGVPAVSVPCGFDARGLPVGLQLVAAPYREALLARVASAYQATSDWHLAQPPIAREPETVNSGASRAAEDPSAPIGPAG